MFYLVIFPLQEELQQVAIGEYTQNPQQQKTVSLSGCPILAYNISVIYFEDKITWKKEAVDMCKEECEQWGPYPCDETVFSVCCLIMAENFLPPPTHRWTFREILSIPKGILQTLLRTKRLIWTIKMPKILYFLLL